jgi:hypothetical protein
VIARLACSAGLTAFALLCAPSRARAQETAYRFEIDSVGDSTIVLSTARHEWIRAKQKGIAVDPMRHDALVARFVILRVDPKHKQALAVVTGQTTRLTTDHVALIDRPARKWFAQPAFWIGTALGAVIGAVVAH